MSATGEDGHRWANITPDDHSGTLYIVTFLGFTYTSLTFLTRVIVKWHVLGLDDVAMLVAQVCTIINFAHKTFHDHTLITVDHQSYPVLTSGHFSVGWSV